MSAAYRQIDVEKNGDVYCARLLTRRLSEKDVYEFGEDILKLINKEGCRKLVLDLGPKDLLCIYSVFLAKMVTLNRRLTKDGGALKLARVGPETYHVFEICHLHTLFDFCPDVATAVAELSL